jgi:hypothetical protein
MAVAKIATKAPAIIAFLFNATTSFDANPSELDGRLKFFKGIIQYRDPSDIELLGIYVLIKDPDLLDSEGT